MAEAEAEAAVAVVTGDAARCGEVVRSTTREEPHGEATMGQVRMGAPGAPGAIGALIAAGSPTVGARYVGGCLGRGGRAIGD